MRPKELFFGIVLLLAWKKVYLISTSLNALQENNPTALFLTAEMVLMTQCLVSSTHCWELFF